MTNEERLEEAKKYITSKGEVIHTWQSKETGRQMFSISYWVYKEQVCLGKVMGTDSGLLALIDRLREKERTAIEKGAVPALVAPAVVAKDQGSIAICNNCMTSQPSSNVYCSGCSCRLC
jgi:hypothetical protein